MRTNGTISCMRTVPTSATFNEDGEPNAVTVEWTDPIECFIYERYVDRDASYGEGKYSNISYDIIVEGRFIYTERVKLQRHGEDMGEFPVKNIKHLTLDRSIVTV